MLNNPSSPVDAALSMALAQSLQQIKLMDASTLPPLARVSHRSETDLRLWRSKLSQERRKLSALIQAVCSQSQHFIPPAVPRLKQAQPPGLPMLTGKIMAIP